MKTLAIVTIPSCYLSAVYGIKEILEQPSGGADAPFSVSLLDPEALVRSEQAFDFVVIPPFRATWTHEEAVRHESLYYALRARVRQGCVPVSVCAGAYILCEAGLADGLTITTHWDLAADISARFPAVNVSPNRVLIDEGTLISGGGITSFQDVSLYLIKRYASVEAARRTAAVFVLNSAGRSQLEYAMERLEVIEDEVVANALSGMRARPGRTVKAVASDCGVSTRTLARRFLEAGLGTPGARLCQERIARAREDLETTNLPVKKIADRCGYRDLSAFTRAFSRAVETTPGDYRARHRL